MPNTDDVSIQRTGAKSKLKKREKRNYKKIKINNNPKIYKKKINT